MNTLVLHIWQNDVSPFLQSFSSGLWEQTLAPYFSRSVSMGFDQKVILPQATQWLYQRESPFWKTGDLAPQGHSR